MCEVIRWCLFALLLSYRTSLLSAQSSNCEEFSRGVNFDSRLAIGNWTTIYSRPGPTNNVTEVLYITELTPSHLEKYHYVVKDYPESALKLKVYGSKDTSTYYAGMIVVPKDTNGNLDAWYLDSRAIRRNPTPPWEHHVLKWKIDEGFLLLMSCKLEKIFISSRSSEPDEAKLQRVVDRLPHNEVVGGRIYPNSS